jgi:predicted dehydrogenase
VARFVDAIAGKRDESFGFRAGQRIQELVEAIQGSARESKWLGTG